MIVYALCGTLRTGSTWLCRLLTERSLGLPDEYLEPRVRDPLIAGWGLKHSGDYIPELWLRRTANGVFGIKLLWGQRDYDWVGDWDRVIPAPVADVRWILQTRDPHEQAASWLTARKSGLIFAKPGAAAEKHTRHDEHELAAYVELAHGHTAGWRRWFRERNLDYLEVRYEELRGDTTRQVDRVADWIYYKTRPGRGGNPVRW